MKTKHKFKKIFIWLIIFLICGCSIQNKKEESKKQEIVQKDKEKDFVEPYVDDNPIKLGLYVNQNGSRTLISTYESDLTLYTDIVSLEVYYTMEETLISGSQKNVWQEYYQKYSNIDTYKIGYHIHFKASDLEVDKTILNPSNVESFFDYIQIYLYDDIHQDSNWYDHISQDEVTEETRFTSIKLTASTKIEEITSPITITAFTYDSDDFNDEGTYRGKSSYQVIINRK